MNNQKMVAVLLQECKQELDQISLEVEDQSKGVKSRHPQNGALLPDDLKTLIEEAKEMKWPFVPEKWQYKQAIDLEDKTNLKDVINARLHDLLVCLKSSISVKDYATAAAIVFLIDRFVYWVDGSSQLLQIAKRLHKLHPTTPIAPQLVIRQARVSVNAGKLLKAEYILSSLINDNGATGVWKYAQESDQILVQSVCMQIRGQILQKLGMWYEAAELIWASIVGFFTLPQPDKKGIASSLGILADIFVSMSENDYKSFKINSYVDLNLLKEFDHRLLSAAEACKLAAAFSQFTPLFVLTAMNIRGMCLLSYSYSSACPSEKRKLYLLEAKESFEIGLLSKKDKELVTSKQELHSFVKAVFCLSKVHQQLYGESMILSQVSQLCQEALQKLYTYGYSTHPEEQDKEILAEQIMCLVMSAKEQLQVPAFPNSDAKSYIPDSYKKEVEKQIMNGQQRFEEILRMYSQHHASVCEVFESACSSHKMRKGEGKMGACITAMKTETRNVDTVCPTEERSHHRKDPVKISVSQKARKGHEGLKGPVRKKLSRVPAVDFSLDEETEGEPSEMTQSNSGGVSSSTPSRSELSSSLRSWDKISKSSTSWEEMDNNESEMPQEKETKLKASTGKSDHHSSALMEDAEEKPDVCSLGLLSSKTHNLSLQDSQGNCAGSFKHLLKENLLKENTASVNKQTENFEGGHLKGTEHEENASEHPLTEASSTNYKNCSDGSINLIIPSSNGLSSSKQNLSGMAVPPSVIDSNSGKRSTEDDLDSSRQRIEQRSRNHRPLVDPEGETVDATEDTPVSLHLPGNSMTSASMHHAVKPKSDNYVQNWINKSATTGASSETPEVDYQPDTVDDWEFVSGNRKLSIGNPTDKNIRDQPSHRPETLSGRKKSLVNQISDCATTEEDEGEKRQHILRSRHSTSSLKSWCRSSQFSSSFSDLENSSFLDSSGSSFVFIERMKEQVLQARNLNSNDYERLLSGAEHSWLVERLKNTSLFKPKLLHKAHSALLLKYSKNSGLWTAQETSVYIGDYLKVAKKGRQRNAFWIHFLHQEETLGRYVGKEYKEEKELLHHFNDVERQMTAQYYVTEFNKRLYEQDIPTQIFYIPSAVLLILEGKSIQGCITTEPYILGEFVKLSNNTKVVKSEYKATEYGLAYGHFCYEFSQGSDVVVDLQGWVTGNGKGLIYLTDPQIHSVSQKEASCLTNFGKKGIYYFFNNQHTECNEICHHLSLTRPSIEKPT
ncbi:alpha-protein kinase 1 [Sphaerodactylus townsendi]|uniref:alpha-protein kinase 1 n=1 Tax=Sphaerodactylus townsendi TaxID=933632 RepID=UPI002026AE50|nr:alpha-protein kinase 1 [Sphaerodactylus townsendi]